MTFKLAEMYTAAVDDVWQLADTSFGPLSLDSLYDLALQHGAAEDALVLDAGCANGGNGRKLLKRTGCRIEGVEYLDHLVTMGREENKQAKVEDRYRIQQASILDIPFPDDHFEFVLCRDVLTHIADLPGALAECRRVLQPNKCMLVYMTQATVRLSPDECDELYPPLGIAAQSMNETHVQACLTEKFTIEQVIVMGSQGRQHMEESGDHDTTQGLLRISRLLTWPEPFIERFGQRNYEIALAGARYGVYQLLGKLQPTIYVLRKT